MSSKKVISGTLWVDEGSLVLLSAVRGIVARLRVHTLSVLCDARCTSLLAIALGLPQRWLVDVVAVVIGLRKSATVKETCTRLSFSARFTRSPDATLSTLFFRRHTAHFRNGIIMLW